MECRGCVIRKEGTGRGLFKRKIGAFSEVQYQHALWREARQGGGVYDTGPTAKELAIYEIQARVTEQRVHAVMSKIGRVSSKDRERCREVLHAFVDDVVEALDLAAIFFVVLLGVPESVRRVGRVVHINIRRAEALEDVSAAA